MDKILKAFTDQIDREKREKEEIERLKKKALKGGIRIKNEMFQYRDIHGISLYGIEKEIDEEIEFQKQLKFKEGVFNMDGSVEWREMN